MRSSVMKYYFGRLKETMHSFAGQLAAGGLQIPYAAFRYFNLSPRDASGKKEPGKEGETGLAEGRFTS